MTVTKEGTAIAGSPFATVEAAAKAIGCAESSLRLQLTPSKPGEIMGFKVDWAAGPVPDGPSKVASKQREASAAKRKAPAQLAAAVLEMAGADLVTARNMLMGLVEFAGADPADVKVSLQASINGKSVSIPVTDLMTVSA